MATSFLQRARERKIAYFAAIAVLLTVSLIHRKFYLTPQADAMQLRESAKGEVDLTTSAVRVALTGSRGIATTFLWYNAMEKQKRNEWTQFKVLVASITKLQPYFITPWLYQSWNLSFNVAVEFDRPRDKYDCISEGILMLAEGERRNRGLGDEAAAGDPSKVVFPGHPELRHFVGFYYQLKIGTSDERLTMRSLLEMSCIDPADRDPEKLLKTNEKNEKVVNLDKFASFTLKHPRLVRRLREQLGISDPAGVVRFLALHQNIPHRFHRFSLPAGWSEADKDAAVRAREFPVLPPREGDSPDRTRRDLTGESVDVFLVCRTWYQFAQKPLPPPNDTPGITEAPYDKMRYRVPKQMVTQLFRAYPARAQVYIAETLESEGYFDNTGWTVGGWFDELAGTLAGEILNPDNELEVGTESRFHSRLAWERGYQAYKDYGEKNGIYFSPALTAKLNQRAKLCRDLLDIKPGQVPQPRGREWTEPGEKKESLDAHLRLHFSQFYRSLSNFDAFFYQAEGEKSPLTILARKLLFVAEQKRRGATKTESLLKLYDEAWPVYVRACLEFPRFAQVGSMQEDLYEIHQRYLRISQDVRRQQFTGSAVWFAHRSFAPMDWTRYVAISLAEKEKQQMVKVIPFITRRGPLDAVHYFDAPSAKELREVLFLWTQGAQLGMSPHFAGAITYPGHQFYLLTRADAWHDPVAPWRSLIEEETRRVVLERPGMRR